MSVQYNQPYIYPDYIYICFVSTILGLKISPVTIQCNVFGLYLYSVFIPARGYKADLTVLSKIPSFSCYCYSSHTLKLAKL